MSRPARVRRLLRAGALIFITAAAVAPSAVDGQVRRGRQTEEEKPPWAPVSIGGRIGYDQRFRGEMIGAGLRIPFLRNGKAELNPSADILFATGGRETAYNLEAAFVPGGRRGGIFAGGGVGWRKSPITTEDGTLFGYNLSVGGKTYLAPSVQLEALIRWSWLQDSDRNPNSVSLGVNYVFGGGIRPDGS